jgi:C_GCAxxG_C_C family probable redox protein
MTSELAKEAGEAAAAAFSSGLYCAESVVLALARTQGIESDLLPQAATGLCGGMSRTCGPCGALTGAILGVGLALGRACAEQSVQPAYVATQQLIGDFEREFGARDCDELLGCDLGTPEGQATFREKRLGERCARYTRRAAEMAAGLIEAEKAAAASQA